ncbi:hypothetical protein LSAT2_019653, partial [Lamellibrachia satsuma]
RMMLASRIHARMELLALNMIKGFGVFAVLITKERLAHPMMLASRIHARMELLALKMIKGFGAFAVLITMGRRAHAIMLASRIHARMGLLALKMIKGFVAFAVLITMERHAHIGEIIWRVKGKHSCQMQIGGRMRLNLSMAIPHVCFPIDPVYLRAGHGIRGGGLILPNLLRYMELKLQLVGSYCPSSMLKSVLIIRVNEACDSWPCRNGGECENEGKDYKCTCKGHMSGTQCEKTGKNWALGGKTQQSHFKYNKYAPASKAVDGNIDGIFDHHSCSKTIYNRQMRSSWWKVKTRELLEIEGVVITNRADCCGWVMKRLSVRAGPHKGRYRTCNKLPREIVTGETVYIGCRLPVKGRGVMIKTKEKTLILCEVAIYGKQVYDVCPSQPCKNGGTCDKGKNSYTCWCKDDFIGTHCETYKRCSPNPCDHGGTCEKFNNDYTCSCKGPYKGIRCQTYDPCVPKPCQHNGQCTQTGRSYRCSCHGLYDGRNCGSMDACKSNPCKHGGVCSKNGRGFHCACRNNYEGTTCQSHDPCGSHPCVNGGTCTKKGRRVTCKCQSGFHGAKCEAMDACKSNPCKHGGVCSKNGRGFHCACRNNYEGTTCQSHDPCGSHPCANGGTCTKKGRRVTCKCQSGFHGAKCEVYDDPCSSKPCANGGSCYGEGDNIYCFCEQNYRGDRCEEFKPCHTNPCLNSGTCVGTGTSSTCLCPKNFRGQICETFDPCFFIPCHKSSKCVSTGHPNKGNGSWSAHCECDGYHKGDLCESKVHLCHHADRPDCISECSTVDDGIYALCENCHKYVRCRGGRTTVESCPNKPFWGFNSETGQCQVKSPVCYDCSDPCKYSPCQGGGTCIPYSARYECTCAEERVGYRCQFDKSQCTPNPCQNGGECVVDGSYNATLHYVVYRECFCQMGYSGDTCEQCLGMFTEIENRRHPDGDIQNYILNLAECKQTCKIEDVAEKVAEVMDGGMGGAKVLQFLGGERKRPIRVLARVVVFGAYIAALDVLFSVIDKRAAAYSDVSDRFGFLRNLAEMETVKLTEMRQAAEKL